MVVVPFVSANTPLPPPPGSEIWTGLSVGLSWARNAWVFMMLRQQSDTPRFRGSRNNHHKRSALQEKHHTIFSKRHRRIMMMSVLQLSHDCTRVRHAWRSLIALSCMSDMTCLGFIVRVGYIRRRFGRGTTVLYSHAWRLESRILLPYLLFSRTLEKSCATINPIVSVSKST
jgi:hypothetical protein